MTVEPRRRSPETQDRGSDAPHARFDLSRSFGALGTDTELFVDAYHFVDLGNEMIAQALADQIAWNMVKPISAVAAEEDPLTIVKFDATEPGMPFTARVKKDS